MDSLSRYVNDINQALRARAFYAALALSLTIPDLCGSIEYPQQPQPGQRYRDWFTNWCLLLQNLMTAADCWALRCAYLHSGLNEFGGPAAQHAVLGRIHFTYSTGLGIWLSRFLAAPVGATKPAIETPVETFCRDMGASALGWFNARRNVANVTEALNRLLEIRPAS